MLLTDYLPINSSHVLGYLMIVKDNVICEREQPVLVFCPVDK